MDFFYQLLEGYNQLKKRKFKLSLEPNIQYKKTIVDFIELAKMLVAQPKIANKLYNVLNINSIDDDLVKVQEIQDSLSKLFIRSKVDEKEVDLSKNCITMILDILTKNKNYEDLTKDSSEATLIKDLRLISKSDFENFQKLFIQLNIKNRILHYIYLNYFKNNNQSPLFIVIVFFNELLNGYSRVKSLVYNLRNYAKDSNSYKYLFHFYYSHLV